MSDYERQGRYPWRRNTTQPWHLLVTLTTATCSFRFPSGEDDKRIEFADAPPTPGLACGSCVVIWRDRERARALAIDAEA